MPQKLNLDIVRFNVSANSIKQMMRHFASVLSDQIEYSVICEELDHLEGNDTAAIGQGNLVFHGWNNKITKPMIAFIRLNQPMQTVTTPDQQPINKAWLILSPKSDGPIHLSRLSRVTRFAKDEHFSLMLDGADSEDSAIAIFDNINGSNEFTPRQNHHAA